MTLAMLTASLLMHLLADVAGLEEPSPEVFLQPRNFNPHPYELGYDPRGGDRRVSRLREFASQIDVFGADDRGPILFPPNDQPGDGRVASDPYAVAQLKDTHPYAGVAAKKKKKYGIPEQVNPQVYKALAAHGAKVLGVPRAHDLQDVPNYLEHYDYDDQTKKSYAFSYAVVDRLTGDDFSHRQSQDSHATNGEYRVKLPDGRVQIVSYTADRNGYKADVQYSGDAAVAPPPTRQHLSATARPPHAAPLYADSALRVDGAAPPKSRAHDFINQHLITAERKPAYYGPRDDAGVLFILPDKYRAAPEKAQLSPNIRAQKAHERGKFIAATLAPYVVAGGGERALHALSTLAPDLDSFNPVYIDAPAYKLPTIH